MHKPQPSNDPGRPPKGPAGIGVPPSISDRQIEALGDIAKGLRAIAAAVRETQGTEEAQIAAPVPAVGPDSGSGGSRTLGDRLRALTAGPHPDVLLVTKGEGEWIGICMEADRLDGKRERQAQTIGELQEVRERLTGQVERARALAREWARRHGMGNRSPGYGSFAAALLEVLDETNENGGPE